MINMLRKLQYLFLLNFFAAVLAQNAQESKCNDLATCKDCLKALQCVWCTKPKNGGNNCVSSAMKSSCAPSDLIDPVKEFKVLKNEGFRSESPPIQIKPQKLRLSLRKDDVHEVKFQFKRARNYPVDLYYLMDFSASMSVYKKTLAGLSQKLAKTMKANTNDFRLGLGSFIDKPTAPYISEHPDKLKSPCTGCIPPYSFKHHMSLASDDKKFSSLVADATLSGNVDAPEGGFDALMQAMVCEDVIGWRNYSRHLIVFSSDSFFHSAGEGKFGGAVKPNDAQCRMRNNEYTGSLEFDYPSVSQINFVAKQRNMNIIFATKTQHMIYQAYERLAGAVENARIGNIETDVDKLIDNFYKEIVESLEFGVEAPNFVEVI